MQFMHIKEIIQEIRDFIVQEKVSPHHLFELAGIKCRHSAARFIRDPQWNPTAATLAKLQDAIRVYRLGRD